MRHIVTGGAGFIGRHLVRRLLVGGADRVTVIDDFSSSAPAALADLKKDRRLVIRRFDLRQQKGLAPMLKGHDHVWHLAANPDVRSAATDPGNDVKRGIIASWNLLEGMRAAGVSKITFASSSTVYGEHVPMPTPESAGPLLPISLYGATKLGVEGLLSAYAHTFGFRCWIFRFANVVGPGGTHGVIVDFLRKLRVNPMEMEILGDGSQQKSYLTVEDCVSALEFAVQKTLQVPGLTDIFNLGTTDQVTVRRIAEIVVEELGLRNVRFVFTGGDRGWRGDVPKMLLAIDRIQSLGWAPATSSEGAVRAAVRHLIAERPAPTASKSRSPARPPPHRKKGPLRRRK